MKEIRIHARAGQGAITTATLLGNAYFQKGMYPYAFPHFGAARMGAPMNAFVRVDSVPVRLRSQIYEPDYLIIVDATLMRGFNCFSGLQENGIAIINHREGVEVPKVGARQKTYVVPANDIAMKTIGRSFQGTPDSPPSRKTLAQAIAVAIRKKPGSTYGSLPRFFSNAL